MKTFKIISADVITEKGKVPFVGLTVEINGTTKKISRSCSQSLYDMHKSARASNLPATMFDNGIDKVNPTLFNQFTACIIGLVGKVGFGDIEFYEAGAEYEVTAVSSAFKNGLAKLGDIFKTEKEGARIEGFLTFPLTDLENGQQRLIDSNPVLAFQLMFGITMQAPIVVQDEPARIGGANAFEAPTVEQEIVTEVFGETVVEDEPAEVVAPKATTKATSK